MFGSCTLVADEMDLITRNQGHQELMGILRQGFQKGAGVLRAEAEGDTWMPKDYEVFGPKVLAGRRNFPDAALESRCMRVYTQSGVPHSHIPVELTPEHDAEVLALQNKLLQWRLDCYSRPLLVPERLPVESRLLQLYIPLASVVGDPAVREILDRAVMELQEELADARAESPEGRVLKALVELTTTLDPTLAPHRVLVKRISSQTGGEQGPLAPRRVKAICLGFGLADAGRTNAGATVLFDPGACVGQLAQYGLVKPASSAVPKKELAVA